MSFVAELPVHFAAAGDDGSRRRRRALERVDRELGKGEFETALSFVRQLQVKQDGLRAFGSAKQKLFPVDERNLNGTDLSSLRPMADSIMDAIQRCKQSSLLNDMSNEEFESVHNDEHKNSSYKQNRYKFVEHEAGHFLVGYLLGDLPISYEIPSVEAIKHNKFVTGRVGFSGFDFLTDVGIADLNDSLDFAQNLQANRNGISSETWNNFICVVLGGLVAEHMLFGYSEGPYADAYVLDRVLRWCGYTKTEAKSQVRWATFNTIYILRSHKEARTRLAKAMSKGKSIASCIDAIESTIHPQ